MDRARVRVPESTLHVEGTDDREVIYQLCNACKLDNGELFEVRCANGVENLIQLAAIRNSAPTIGFVLDADGDPESRWRALRQSVLPHYSVARPR